MKKKQTIHLYIKGGCGNQFFQYAFARNLQEKLDADLVINYSEVIKDTQIWSIDKLLDDFNVVDYTYSNGRILKDKILVFLDKYRGVMRLNDFKKETYRFYLRTAKWLPKIGVYFFDAPYHKFPLTKAKTILIDGYFESAKYFEEIDDKIKKELTPKAPPLEQNRELLAQIHERQSVCVTIKRMDVDNPDTAEVFDYDINYFYTGIEYMKKHLENPLFVIFADDLEWCKNNLKIDGDVVFETEGNPLAEKIRLMSACKHFIIHNSTFSWWAQHLSDYENKIVLGPYKWLIRDDQPIHIYEKNWRYITPDGRIVKRHA